MDRKNKLVRTIRRLQTVVSITLFSIIFLFCWDVTGFDITEIQLSAWGGSESPTTNSLWNSIIVLLSLSILSNVFIFIKKHVRMKNKIIPYTSFMFVCFSLFLVGMFDVDQRPIHNLAAFTYFFSFPFAIFLMAYVNRKTLLYKEWFTHLLFSITMIILPLSAINMFEGMGVSETIHIIVVCAWNIYVAFKRFH
jgi:hypothetical membrane protein